MPDEILRKNIESIAQNNSFLLNDLLTTDFSQIGDGVSVEASEDSSQAAYFRYDQRKYLLHSRYDPVTEAQRLVKDIEETRDYLIVVFGIGLGYHLFELKNKISPDTRVIIVEHNLDVLRYALNNIDFSDVFNTSQFILFYGDEQQIGRMAIILAGLNYYNLIHNIKPLVLPNYHAYAGQNKRVLQHISERLLNTVMTYGNDLADHFVGFANMCKNTEAILSSYSIDDIKDRYKNMPAIIVSAGPSLDKNIHFLNNANGKALIITTDASMRACEKHNVQPDMIASIERDKPTYTFFYEGRTFPKDLVLLAPGSIWPSIYEEFSGKTLAMSRNDIGFEKMWMSTFDHFKYVSMGHSCATVAFAAAKEAGCNPIILVGQDLAYTSGKKHSDLAHTKYEGDNDDRDSTAGVYLEDAEGNLLKSSMVFKLFKEWFEFQILNNPRLQVIDATEGGAYIKGTTLMTLQEAIETYCQVPVEKGLVDYLPEKKINNKVRVMKFTKLSKTITRDLNLLRGIRKSASAHLKMLVKMQKNVNKKNSEPDLVAIIQKLRRGDKIIQKILSSASIEAYYKQIIIQTIAQVKKIGNTLTEENVRRNHFLQHNLMFMIVNSTDLIINEYSNAKEIIDNQLHQIVAEEGKLN